MTTIIKAQNKDIIEISKILIPGFKDKVLATIGENEKANIIIQEIIITIKGEIFIAIEEERIVGAIIISTSKINFKSSIIKKCFKELGIIKTIRAMRIVNNYQRSVPKKEENEATLEAVAVIKEFQGKGIGEKLILKSEDFLKENNYKYFGLGVKTNNKAVDLYKKLNFSIISDFDNKLGNWYYMRKEL